MNRAIGVGLMAVGVIGILLYGWLVFFSPWQVLILQLTAFVAVAAVFGILAWVGYALITTPPPKPIEEIEKEVQKALEETPANGREPRQLPSRRRHEKQGEERRGANLYIPTPPRRRRRQAPRRKTRRPTSATTERKTPAAATVNKTPP